MKVALGFVVMVGCTIAANLLMKLGAVGATDRLMFFGLSWRTILGLAVFGLAGIIYAWLLRFLPLNVAQSFAAAQFVGVILASAFFLSETVTLPRWIGIALIAVGILIVGLTIGSGDKEASAHADIASAYANRESTADGSPDSAPSQRAVY